MTFDGITTRCVVNELNNTLLNGKIEKIYQVENDEINILVRAEGCNYTLLLSSSSSYPRFYITDSRKKGPDKAPIFSMLLRKHIQGGKIIKISQYGLDRNISFIISSRNEIGDEKEYTLLLELTGRNNNIILIDSDNKIIDSIKRVPHSVSRIRQILPGISYELPPSFDKHDTLTLNFSHFEEIIKSQDLYLPIFKAIYLSLTGFSPKISKELCYKANIDGHQPISSLERDELSRLTSELENLVSKIKNNDFSPSYTADDYNNITGFYPFSLSYDSELYLQNDSISEILKRYYTEKDKTDKILQKTSHIRKLIANETSKETDKLNKLNEDLTNAKDREQFKLYADLLSAYQFKYTPGDTFIITTNFYTEEQNSIKIPLDNTLSLQANIQHYYKKYSKLKTGETIITEQIENTIAKLSYLENIKLSLEIARTDDDINSINDELVLSGLRKKHNVINKRKQAPQKYLEYNLSDDCKILVGKNNIQNELITHKIATKKDYWFHIKNSAGSHVILQINGNREPDDNEIYSAASFAAYFSSVAQNASIEIDYTKKINVKRHFNKLPGLVNYTNFKTIIVDMNRDEFKNYISTLENNIK